MNPVVGILMGSDSDLAVMSKAAKVLDELGIAYECTIISAHRMPDKIYEYAKTAKARGLKVLIAGAGGAAHLPGITAAMTTLPVIGVPMLTSAAGGLDSLYSIVQMPSGIPVATMAIGGAQNAGLMAARMLAISDETLSKKLADYADNMRIGVEKKAEKLERIGYEEYLKQM